MAADRGAVESCSAFNDIPPHDMPFFNTAKSSTSGADADVQKGTDFSNTAASPWAAPVGDGTDTAPEDYFPGSGQGATPFGGAVPQAATPANSNVLNSDVTVVGTLRFIDDLLVDGIVEGEILSEGVLTVGENAKISGTEKDQPAIRTKSAIIHGRVIGSVVVSERVELASTAVLQGDITASSISIQEGAQIVGHVQVGANVGIESPVKAVVAGAKKQAKQGEKGKESDSSNLLV